MDAEGGCLVALTAVLEISAQYLHGLRSLMNVVQRTGGVDDVSVKVTILRDRAAGGDSRLLRHVLTDVEARQIDQSARGVRDLNSGEELTFRARGVAALFGEQGTETMGDLRKSRLNGIGQSRCFVGTAANQKRRGDEELAEIIGRRRVSAIQIEGCLEGGADLSGEFQAGDGAGVFRLHAEGAASPVLGFRVSGKACLEREPALVGRLRPALLGQERAAKQKVCRGIAGFTVYRGTETGHSLIGAALQ